MSEPVSFHYDQHAPLEFAVVAEREQAGATVQDIAYASPLGGKVSGYLIIPQSTPPRAGVIFGHWGQGNRDEFVAEAAALTQLGFVALCLDAPFRRPESYAPQQELAESDQQWILDVRRGVDLLMTRFALPPERLGYVGHSLGASSGGAIAGIEHRLTAFVLMAGWYAATECWRMSQHPKLVSQRAALGTEALEAILAAEAPFDAIHYIGQAAPSALFFQFARQDDFVTVRDGERYFALASEPKQIAWYVGCNHELSGAARRDRARFLCERFGIGEPAPEILRQLDLLPAPVPLEA